MLSPGWAAIDRHGQVSHFWHLTSYTSWSPQRFWLAACGERKAPGLSPQGQGTRRCQNCLKALRKAGVAVEEGHELVPEP